MGRKKQKAEPTKRSLVIGPYRQVCLASVSMLALTVAMPPPAPPPPRPTLSMDMETYGVRS